MRFFTIGIAGKTIGITAEFTRMYNICRRYMTNGTPDFCVKCSVTDYDREAAEYETQYNSRETPSDVFFEETAMLRKVSDVMIAYGTFMLHGAAVAIGNQSFVFTAKSGTGKTTHILKWLEHCPEAFIVNGDKPFIKISDDGTSPLICGSPWAGKEGMSTNTMVPLKAIVLMERAENNHIEQISFAQAFPALLQQTYRPDDAEKMRKTLRLMQRLSPAVSFWRFQFNNFKDDCFDVAYNALVGKQP